MTDPLQFLLTVIVLLITPGPTNTMMATAGAGPTRSPVPLLAAELAGYACIITLASIVLVPLVAAWPPAGIAIKLLVIAYLIFAAVRLWGRRLVLNVPQALIGPRLVFATTFLNPKGLIFAVAVFPHTPQIWLYALAFAALVGVCGFAWFSLGRGLARISGPRASLLPRVAAVALVGFAALVANSIGH